MSQGAISGIAARELEGYLVALPRFQVGRISRVTSRRSRCSSYPTVRAAATASAGEAKSRKASDSP